MVAGTIYNLLTAPRLEAHAGDGAAAGGDAAGGAVPGDPSAWPPRVSLLIPARNEADNLRILLPLLREISYPELEILILDDGSADATASLISGAGGRVRLIKGLPLPEGLVGQELGVLAACGGGPRGDPDLLRRGRAGGTAARSRPRWR